MSGHGQLQGAAVFKALVQGRFEVYPDGVRVIFLGLGLVAAHHLEAVHRQRQTASRSDSRWLKLTLGTRTAT